MKIKNGTILTLKDNKKILFLSTMKAYDKIINIKKSKYFSFLFKDVCEIEIIKESKIHKTAYSIFKKDSEEYQYKNATYTKKDLKYTNNKLLQLLINLL